MFVITLDGGAIYREGRNWLTVDGRLPKIHRIHYSGDAYSLGIEARYDVEVWPSRIQVIVE